MPVALSDVARPCRTGEPPRGPAPRRKIRNSWLVVQVALATLAFVGDPRLAFRGCAAGSVPEAGEAAGSPFSQTPSQTPTIRVEVRQVLVPVTVNDAKGHSVVGLAASDFKVFEDGVEQKVISLTSEAGGAARLFEPEPNRDAKDPEISRSSETPPPDRVYLVVIDTLNSDFGNFAQIRSALKDLFKGIPTF
jgi:hypothetical protein